MRIPDLAGIEKAERPVLFCSFGKDSSVVLHSLGPWLHKAMVVFLNYGGLYPDIIKWAEDRGSELPNYFCVYPPGDLWEDIRTKGWPVDIEIAALGRNGAEMAEDAAAHKFKLRVYTEFFRDRIWLPMFVFTKMYGADCLITGERRQDHPFMMNWQQRDNGCGMVLRPVFDWSDEDVWEYIDANAIGLPKSYQTRNPQRRDNYVCLGGHDLSPELIDEMKREWPDIYRKVFVEEGFKEVIPVMLKHLSLVKQKWEAIQKIVEE
jgi:3'-phosphoadenosine 5'-phosphosulfate sulfotransferase (PAPS reductase)/FAD synthetase